MTATPERPQGTRTVEPMAGTIPTPRDPVATRAQIASISEERSREIRARMRALRDEYRRLKGELLDLESVAEFAGITSGEEGE